MNVSKIEESFFCDLMLAYGLSKFASTRLKTGSYNMASGQEEVLWKKKLFFKGVVGQDIRANAETRNN